MLAALAFLQSPDEVAPCGGCTCDETGRREQHLWLNLGGERTPLRHCLRRHLPEWSLELAEAALLFKYKGVMPEAGGWNDQPHRFTLACRLAGWRSD